MEIIETCSRCKKKYDTITKGKMRMGLPYCSVDCADLDWPEFKKEKERLETIREDISS